MPLSTISSFVLWLRLNWWIFGSAISITIRGDFSSSPLAFCVELLCAAASLYAYLATHVFGGEGWVKMRKLSEWKAIVQFLGIGAIVFVVAWVILFLLNVKSVYREMVLAPPSINVELIPQRYTLDLKPGIGPITEQYLSDRFQYELDITNQSHKLAIAPLDLRFQFPYGVESYEIKSKDRDDDLVDFIPEKSSPSFSGGGTITYIGPPPIWRNYRFHASGLKPNGKIKIIIRLNGKLDPRAKSHDPQGPSILPRDQSLFISGYLTFSMGEQEVKRVYYAPMFLDDNTRTLYVGYAEDHIPEDAGWDFQLGP